MSEVPKFFSRMNRSYCEANITTETIRQSVYRIGYDMNGRRFDLGPSVVDQPGEVEATANCEHCDLNETFRREGNGLWGAYNVAKEAAGIYITQECARWNEEVEKGNVSGEMPLGKVPGNF